MTPQEARAWALLEAETIQPEDLEAAGELFDRIVNEISPGKKVAPPVNVHRERPSEPTPTTTEGVSRE